MKIGYVCPKGHLTVGVKPENLMGSLPKKIHCLNCNHVATIFEEHTFDESVPAHFEFYRPKMGEIVHPDDEKLLNGGYLLLRQYDDHVLQKELVATKGLQKLAMFLLANIDEKDRLPDIVDTAILHLKEHFMNETAVRKLVRNNNQKLN